jgi:acyl dehydratase
MIIFSKKNNNEARAIKEFKIGQKYTEEWTPTLNDIKKYAQLSGDYNPIHIYKESAEKLGYKLNIVHGNLTCSFISKVVGMNFPGKNSLIIEQNISFPNSIYPDDTIKFDFIILSVNNAFKVLEIKVKGIKIDSKFTNSMNTVLRGKIICKV